jgi:hypothetical protein
MSVHSQNFPPKPNVGGDSERLSLGVTTHKSSSIVWCHGSQIQLYRLVSWLTNPALSFASDRLFQLTNFFNLDVHGARVAVSKLSIFYLLQNATRWPMWDSVRMLLILLAVTFPNRVDPWRGGYWHSLHPSNVDEVNNRIGTDSWPPALSRRRGVS